MKRFEDNPILKPVPSHPWESRRVFNAAALYAGGRVHILYRAVGEDGISRLGYAASSDGYMIDERSSDPVFEPSNSTEDRGCEDPRLTLLGEECLMSYTALRDRYVNAFQVALTEISLGDLLSGSWRWGERWLPFPGIRNKNAVVFPSKIAGRYAMYHRIDPDICVAYSDDLKRWFDLKAVIHPRHDAWDSMKVGAAGPPIEVNEGWLFIYHGVDFSYVYRLGSMLIDKDHPERILYRSERPILEPRKNYERFGKVPNVVFSCGSAVLDDRLLIYYGGADTVVCGAEYDLSELVP